MIKNFDVPEEKRKELGEYIKKLRIDKGYGFNQFAMKANINVADLHRIEKAEKKKINAYQLINIAKAFNIDYKDLYKIVGYLEENDKDLKGNAKIILNEEELKEIPVYGDVSAGNGKIIYGDIVDHYLLDSSHKNIDQLIALRVSGDSMENKIPNNSQVLIRRGVEVESGNVGVFCIGEECFVKQLKIYGDTLVLKSFNPLYEEIQIKETDDFITIGKVVECKIKF